MVRSGGRGLSDTHPVQHTQEGLGVVRRVKQIAYQALPVEESWLVNFEALLRSAVAACRLTMLLGVHALTAAHQH